MIESKSSLESNGIIIKGWEISFKHENMFFYETDANTNDPIQFLASKKRKEM